MTPADAKTLITSTLRDYASAYTACADESLVSGRRQRDAVINAALLAYVNRADARREDYRKAVRSLEIDRIEQEIITREAEIERLRALP